MNFFYKLKPFNRRQYPRFAPLSFIRCTCLYTESGNNREIPLDIVNISRGGLLIITGENKILPGITVEIRFKVPGRREELSLCGEVVRTYRRHKEKLYYSGLRFRDMNAEGIRLLLDSMVGRTG
jgi:hypothetical protein